MEIDKTILFNILTATSAVVLAGGDMSQLELGVLPRWGVAILVLLVSLVVSTVSREQVKEERRYISAALDYCQMRSQKRGEEEVLLGFSDGKPYFGSSRQK